ncbi:MAG: hypothetical protein ACR2PK_17900, partial [Acidimicrobiales bacterium]
MATPARTTNDRARLRRMFWSPFVFIGFAFVVVGALVVNVVMRTNSGANKTPESTIGAAELTSGLSPGELSKLAT